MPNQEDSSDPDPAEGDSAARVTLSEAIPSIQDMLQGAYSDLAAVRHRLRGQELPDEFDIDESELKRPAVRAREVAARLETAAKALRNASGEVGDQPGLSPEE